MDSGAVHCKCIDFGFTAPCDKQRDFACQLMGIMNLKSIERAAHPVLLSLLSAMGANWRPTDTVDRHRQAHL